MSCTMILLRVYVALWLVALSVQMNITLYDDVEMFLTDPDGEEDFSLTGVVKGCIFEVTNAHNFTNILENVKKLREKDYPQQAKKYENLFRVKIVMDGVELKNFISLDRDSERIHKFLPYAVEDFYYFSFLGVLPRLFRSRTTYGDFLDEGTLTLEVSVGEKCFTAEKYKQNEEFAMIVNNGIVVLTEEMMYRTTKNDLVCSYSDHEDAKEATDMPLALEKCCRRKTLQIGQHTQELVCHDSQRMRSFIADVIAASSILALLFFPMLIRWMPHRPRLDSSIIAVDPKQWTSQRDVQKAESVDEDDLLLIQNQKWIYLDVDPVHLLSSSIYFIINKACLHSSNRVVIVFVRYVTLFIFFAFSGLMQTISFTYYKSIEHYSILVHQEDFRRIFSDYIDSLNVQTQALLNCVYVPAILALVCMLLLFPITLSAKRIPKRLYWRQKCSIFGHNFKCTIAGKYRSTYSPGNDRVSYPDLVHMNIWHNLHHVVEVTFWKALWDSIVCHFCPLCRFHSSQRQLNAIEVLKILTIPLMTIPATLYFFCHCFPALSIFTNLFKNWKTIMVPSTCTSKATRIVILCMTLPMFIWGTTILYKTVLDFVSMMLNVVIFSTIDIIRESGHVLPKVIFVIGIIAYVRQSFVDFNDKYRALKLDIFQCASAIDGTQRQMKDSKLPLLKVGGSLPYEQAIPRAALDYISSYILPHHKTVARSLIGLFCSLFCITLFFTIIIEYQVFDAVTSASEAFISIITVSLPRLAGALETEGFSQLKKMRQSNAIKCLLIKISEVKGEPSELDPMDIGAASNHANSEREQDSEADQESEAEAAV